MSKHFKMVKYNTILIIIQRLSKGTFKGTSKKTYLHFYYISYYLSEAHKHIIRDLYGSDFFFKNPRVPATLKSSVENHSFSDSQQLSKD